MRLFKILLLIFVLQACSSQDADLKQPLFLSLNADINRDPLKNNQLWFESGFITFFQVTLSGERLQGDDYYFESSSAPGFVVRFDNAAFVPELQFNMPIGIYSLIRMQFNMPGGGSPSLDLRGKFQDSSGAIIPVILQVDRFESFDIIAKGRFGDQEIILDNAQSSNAQGQIEFNPGHWFSSVSIEDLQGATRAIFEGQESILISNSSNTDIFSEVDDRLDELNQLTFF
jgi:hypothetical protein